MPVVQHPVLASAVCRRWLWMLGLCGSTSPEINFHQSLEYFYLFSLQSSSNSVLKMELISYSNWIFFSGFLFRGAPLPFFQKLSLQSLISSLTFSSSVLTRACISLGESLSFPPTATCRTSKCPTFRSCFSKQIPRILQGLHADILRDLSVLHPKFYIFFSCSW